MTQAEQIAGYLKLTRAHYTVIDKLTPSPLLELRTQLAQEMSWETLEMAMTIKDALTATNGYGPMVGRSCAHPDSGCDCMACRDCGILLDSQSPSTYFGIQANQCWRCFQGQCEEEAA